MKRTMMNICMILGAAVLLTAGLPDSDAHARAGGGRSFGSRGTRSYSRPASPLPSSPQAAPQPGAVTPPPYQQPQPAGGGFFRNMAGGIAGGMLGGMLFRSLGFGGGGMGGGGIGMFEILLLAGIGYMLYRMISKRRAAESAGYGQDGYQQPGYAAPLQQNAQQLQPGTADVETGLAHIRQMDGTFDENRFNDGVMDMFFKIQGAWMNRDLSSIPGILTEDMRKVFQGDIDKLLQEKRVNRLENIAVRNVEVVEAWQESGQDYITTLIYANLLDYTTDDTTGQVVSGSKTDPVKFEEYWTFTRPVGSNPWRLSAIDQK
jgi:predicted lipid-binding transport protein (Tim44 family)